MNGELTPNAKAILLLTAPFLGGKSKRSVKPLSLGDYGDLARHLRKTGWQPADLFEPRALEELGQSWPRVDIERVQRLLGRGFLLAEAMERWRARAIWVVTRADYGYPRRLKKRMRDKAPPVLYGCGDRAMVDAGGLAVVGSRHVNQELIRYTEDVGRLAAEGDVPIVSGGARGVDQAAMRGALYGGGRALGVLANGLERAALNRENRVPLMDGRLVLLCPYDPAVRFLAGYAMQRNKLIYALADAALVVNSDHGRGGTWAGATEQLERLGFAPVYVRRSWEPCAGLEALAKRGAASWPDPRTPADMRAIVSSDRPVLEPVGPFQQDLFRRRRADSTVAERDAAVTAADERAEVPTRELPSPKRLAPKAVRAATRLLPVLIGEMTRREILAALGLQNPGHLREGYLKPCLGEGWIEMTIPEKPSSRNQRFRITAEGRAFREAP